MEDFRRHGVYLVYDDKQPCLQHKSIKVVLEIGNKTPGIGAMMTGLNIQKSSDSQNAQKF